MPVLLHGDLPYEAPVAAGVNLDVAYILLGDNDVGLVPARQDRHIPTHQSLDTRVKAARLFPVKRIPASSISASSSLLL